MALENLALSIGNPLITQSAKSSKNYLEIHVCIFVIELFTQTMICIK